MLVGEILKQIREKFSLIYSFCNLRRQIGEGVADPGAFWQMIKIIAVPGQKFGLVLEAGT